MSAVLALFNGPLTTWGIVDLLVLLVIIVACLALVRVALNRYGIVIPPWLVEVCVIVLVAVVVIVAIRFVASL